MKKYLFGLITVLFLISLPILMLLASIPLFAFGIYLRIWKNRSKQQRKNWNKEKIAKDWMDTRKKELKPIFNQIMPKDAKSALDIGSGWSKEEDIFKKEFEKYITLDLSNADINQNLEKKSKIPLKDNSLDIIIMSNILEHLCDPVPVIIEANRISKKYLIIGLPNEFPIGARLITLFGMYDDKIAPFGHKHKLSLCSIERFVKSIWGDYLEKKYLFYSIGGKFIPKPIQKLLMKCFPSLFIGEVFYLVKKSKIDKNKIRT